MAVEIEAKIKVNDFSDVKRRLEQSGATCAGDVFETNVILDTEDRTLLAADKGLRVRSARNVASGAESCTLTFKGPRKHGPLKTRDEFETGVESFEDAVRLFQQLKFSPVLTFEKKRQTWELDGCKVELDELPHLGCFVEIEGATEKLVQSVQEKLGLATRPVVKTAYVGLMMTHLQDKGDAGRTVKF